MFALRRMRGDGDSVEYVCPCPSLGRNVFSKTCFFQGRFFLSRRLAETLALPEPRNLGRGGPWGGNKKRKEDTQPRASQEE